MWLHDLILLAAPKRNRNRMYITWKLHHPFQSADFITIEALTRSNRVKIWNEESSRSCEWFSSRMKAQEPILFINSFLKDNFCFPRKIIIKNRHFYFLWVITVREHTAKQQAGRPHPSQLTTWSNKYIPQLIFAFSVHLFFLNFTEVSWLHRSDVY